MKKITELAKGAIIILGCLALLKFACFPVTERLVPHIQSGEIVGFTYQVNSWWGLSFHEYPVSIKKGIPVYFPYEHSEKAEAIPECAYDSH